VDNCAASGDALVSTGEAALGEDTALDPLGAVLVVLGVLGPAGASGTCTVIPSLTCRLVSGNGTGVLASGDGSADAGVSLGVESAEADVREGAGDIMR
jgi:hypothetical protein